MIRVIAVAPLASASAYIERYVHRTIYGLDESHSLMGPHRVRYLTDNICLMAITGYTALFLGTFDHSPKNPSLWRIQQTIQQWLGIR
jgi:hypothetical protein